PRKQSSDSAPNTPVRVPADQLSFGLAGSRRGSPAYVPLPEAAPSRKVSLSPPLGPAVTAVRAPFHGQPVRGRPVTGIGLQVERKTPRLPLTSAVGENNACSAPGFLDSHAT